MGPFCGGGRIIPTEDCPGGRELDTYAGIDFWQVQDNAKRIRGVASRVQRPKYKVFKTFTIRYRTEWGTANTEYQKRVEAIAAGWTYPFLTVQAYIYPPDSQTLVWAGIIRTVDLYEYVQSGKQGTRSIPCDWYIERINGNWDSDDWKEFIVVSPASLAAKGYKVGIVEPLLTLTPFA